MSINREEWLTVKEAATLLGSTPSAIYQRLRRKNAFQFMVCRVSKTSILINKKEITNYVQILSDPSRSPSKSKLLLYHIEQADIQEDLGYLNEEFSIKDIIGGTK